MQTISQHAHHRPIHLSKAEMPATRGLASKITSFPRVLLVKSSWASTPSTLPLLGINELIVWTTVGCARSSPLRTTQHYYFCISRRTKAAPKQAEGAGGWPGHSPNQGHASGPGRRADDGVSARAACAADDVNVARGKTRRTPRMSYRSVRLNIRDASLSKVYPTRGYKNAFCQF